MTTNQKDAEALSRESSERKCAICGYGRYCNNCRMNGDNHAAMFPERSSQPPQESVGKSTCQSDVLTGGGLAALSREACPIERFIDAGRNQNGEVVYQGRITDAEREKILTAWQAALAYADSQRAKQARGIAALGEDAIRFTDDGKRKHNSIEAFFQSEVKSSKDGGFGSVCIEVYGYGNDRDEAEEALLANYRALMEATNNQNTAGVINVKGEG